MAFCDIHSFSIKRIKMDSWRCCWRSIDIPLVPRCFFQYFLWHVSSIFESSEQRKNSSTLCQYWISIKAHIVTALGLHRSEALTDLSLTLSLSLPVLLNHHLPHPLDLFLSYACHTPTHPCTDPFMLVLRVSEWVSAFVSLVPFDPFLSSIRHLPPQRKKASSRSVLWICPSFDLPRSRCEAPFDTKLLWTRLALSRFPMKRWVSSYIDEP